MHLSQFFALINKPVRQVAAVHPLDILVRDGVDSTPLSTGSPRESESHCHTAKKSSNPELCSVPVDYYAPRWFCATLKLFTY